MSWHKNNARAGNFTRSLREQVLRSRPICELCKVNRSTQVDHIVPVSLSRNNTISNARAVCADCHLTKSLAEARDARKAQVARGRMPREPFPGDL